jgi:formyl-CoA transferase
LLTEWISHRTALDCLQAMKDAEVVASRIYDAADILADRTYQERNDVITIADRDLGQVRMQAVVPMLHQRPGSVWRVGPRLGEDNDLVYGNWLGMTEVELSELHAQGVI